MKAIILLIFLSFTVSSLAQEDSLAKQLWQELEYAKLPKKTELKVEEEKLGPADLAFLEEQIPTPQKNNKDEMIIADEVSVGLAAPVRKQKKEDDLFLEEAFKEDTAKSEKPFRERSRKQDPPKTYRMPKLRKRSH